MTSPQNRTVHYVLRNGHCRPFIVTKVWSDTLVNGTLFIDGYSDYGNIPNWLPPSDPDHEAVLVIWKSSVNFAAGHDHAPTPNTWHWADNANANTSWEFIK